jgi:hypothetical protein
MASSPTNRVRYLLDLPLDTLGYYGQKRITATPTTLSGGRDMLYSYRMPIAWRQENGDYLVTNERNSSTTNRHIHAVHSVMRDECTEIGREKHPAPWDGTNQTLTRYRPKHGSRLA